MELLTVGVEQWQWGMSVTLVPSSVILFFLLCCLVQPFYASVLLYLVMLSLIDIPERAAPF